MFEDVSGIGRKQGAVVGNGGLYVKHRGHYDTLQALIGFMTTRVVTAAWVVNDGLLACSVVLITDNEVWEC